MDAERQQQQKPAQHYKDIALRDLMNLTSAAAAALWEHGRAAAFLFSM